MQIAPLIARLTPEALAALPEHRQAVLRYLWRAWARPEQLAPPGDWVTWLIMTGRGWGKNRTAGEWIRQGVYDGVQLFALVGREPSQVRVQMIEHPESGILRLFPPHESIASVEWLEHAQWLGRPRRRCDDDPGDAGQGR